MQGATIPGEFVIEGNTENQKCEEMGEGTSIEKDTG